jgi:hypothetical protein
MTDKLLNALISRAKTAATDNGAPYAVFNLNRIGARMLVVRPAGNITGADAVAAGPFNPGDA